MSGPDAGVAADVHIGCFDSPLGVCGIAWRGRLLVGCQLPEASLAATRARMAERFPGAIDVGHFDPSAPTASCAPAATTRFTAAAASPRPAGQGTGQDAGQVAGPEAIDEWVRIAAVRIQAALAGQADDLADLPLDLSAVAPFERRVYLAARAIPFGRTLHYGDLARQIGEPGAARAVGRALGRNPFAPIVPCHRILAAGAGAGGFSAPGGVATKLRMLVAEGARFGDAPGLFDDQLRTGSPVEGAWAERVASTPARSISLSASAR